MKNAITSTLLVLGLLSVLSCGPDAKRDNPLDPINGRGVSGTIYKLRSSGIVAGAVITARPININTTSDAQGVYNIELEGGQKYVLNVHHPQYHDTTDTIDVPLDGKLVNNFFISGKPSITQPKVNTIVIMRDDGSCDSSLSIRCMGVHPEGRSFLEAYTFNVRINGNNYLVAGNDFDPFTAAYIWDLSLNYIFDPAPHIDSLIVAHPVLFYITPDDGSDEIQVMVPEFKAYMLPSDLLPDHNDTLPTSGYFSWHNAQASGVDITIEVRQGTTLLWSILTANVSSVLCPSTLSAGSYIWRVTASDSTGNKAITEATFTKQ